MDDETRKLELENAILEWKQKHRIADDDPALALPELFEHCLRHLHPNGSFPFEELRYSMQHLERLCKTLSRQTTEAIQELRTVRRTQWKARAESLAFITLAAFLAGVLMGKFFL